MKKQRRKNRGGKPKSKTAPLRRRIRRLQDQLRAVDLRLGSVVDAMERTRTATQGRELFVLDLDDGEMPTREGLMRRLRLDVCRARWNGASVVFTGRDEMLSIDLAVDPREAALYNDRDVVLLRLKENGAKLGAALVEQLYENRRKFGNPKKRVQHGDPFFEHP